MNTLKSARNFVLLVVATILLNLIAGGILFAIEKNLGDSPRIDGRCSAGDAFVNGLDLASSMFSAIGYGHIIPCTSVGQAVSIVLTLIGLPFTLVTLDRIGKMFVFLTRKFWNLATRPCKKKSKTDGDPGQTDKITLDSPLPFSLGIAILVVWILVSSGYFSVLQRWGYGYGLYFTISSLTTVGLADYAMQIVPYTAINYYFLFIGLALMSMCINLGIERVNEAFKKARNELEQGYAQKDDDTQPPGEKAQRAMKKQGPLSFFFSKFQQDLIHEDATRFDGMTEIASQTDPTKCGCTTTPRVKTRDVSLQVSRAGLGFEATPTPTSRLDHPGVLSTAQTNIRQGSAAQGSIDIDLIDHGKPHWRPRSASAGAKFRRGRKY